MKAVLKCLYETFWRIVGGVADATIVPLYYKIEKRRHERFVRQASESVDKENAEREQRK